MPDRDRAGGPAPTGRDQITLLLEAQPIRQVHGPGRDLAPIPSRRSQRKEGLAARFDLSQSLPLPPFTEAKTVPELLDQLPPLSTGIHGSAALALLR